MRTKGRYQRYLLAILLLIQAANGIDGLTLGLVLQYIKADLHLTDTQLGFLGGIAFALFYSVMGIPIARWADRGNRVTIIAVTTAFWSIAVAFCGMAASFMQLLLIRVLVAVGEAGCVPAAQSLIADYFGRAGRPRALATYMLGQSLSVAIGYGVAGWLNQFYGWRITFIVIGAPGLLLAVLAALALREPRRAPERVKLLGEQSATSPTPGHIASMGAEPLRLVLATLWRQATFRHLLASFSVFYFFSCGIQQWQPAFFIRSYGLKTGTLGNAFALVYGLASLVGTYGGGVLATRYAGNNERLQLRGLGISFFFFAIFSALVYVAPNAWLAFCSLAIATAAGATGNGPIFATIQTLVPSRMRATAIAFVYLCGNLIGLGLGPLAAGMLSDALHPYAGEESIRYSLLLLCPGYAWGAWHVWRASRTVVSDLQSVSENQ